MDRRIKFRHLEIFSAVARLGSLKLAAEELNLTQPAISKALKELETIGGQRLADRSRAGVALTPEGELFLQYAEQSTAAVNHGLRSLKQSGVAGGSLKVGALPSVASSLLPGAALEFAVQHPDTLLEVYEGPHTHLTERLRRAGLDMVVGRLGSPETMNGLTFQQLYSEEVVVVARPDSPARKIKSLDELERFRVVYPPKESAIRPLVARMLISKGIPLFSNRIETASYALGLALILSDKNAVFVISRGVVETDIAAGKCVELDVDTSATSGAVGIMTRSGEVTPTGTRAFSKLLLALDKNTH